MFHMSKKGGEQSRATIIKRQVAELLRNSFLCGRIRISEITGVQQILVWVNLKALDSFYVPNAILEITVRFPQNYPEEAPAVFFSGLLVPHYHWYTDMIDTSKWDKSYSLNTIMESTVQQIEDMGALRWIQKKFGPEELFGKNNGFLNLGNPFLWPHNTKEPLPNGQSGDGHQDHPFDPKLDRLDYGYHNQCYFNNDYLNYEFSPAHNFNYSPDYPCDYPLKYEEPHLKHFEANKSLYPIKQQNLLKQQVINCCSNSAERVQARKNEQEHETCLTPVNKNANLPKFIIRIFGKYLQLFRHLYEKKEYLRLRNELIKIKNYKRADKKKNIIGLRHLKRFFNTKIDKLPPPQINRRVINQIVNMHLPKQICRNPQIPVCHKVSYLLACKVYALRCVNGELAERLKSK